MTTTITMTKKEVEEMINEAVKKTVKELIDNGILSVNPVEKPVKKESISAENKPAEKPVKKSTKTVENKPTTQEKSKGFKRAHRTAKVELEDIQYIMTDFGKCEVGHFTHTKTGETMYAVRACEKLEREVYMRMADTMRGFGFSWSLYAMAFIGTDDSIVSKLEKKAVA